MTGSRREERPVPLKETCRIVGNADTWEVRQVLEFRVPRVRSARGDPARTHRPRGYPLNSSRETTTLSMSSGPS